MGPPRPTQSETLWYSWPFGHSAAHHGWGPLPCGSPLGFPWEQASSHWSLMFQLATNPIVEILCVHILSYPWLLGGNFLVSPWDQPASWVCDPCSHMALLLGEAWVWFNALLFCLEILNHFIFEFMFGKWSAMGQLNVCVSRGNPPVGSMHGLRLMGIEG